MRQTYSEVFDDLCGFTDVLHRICFATVGYEMGEKYEKKQLKYKVAGQHCSLWT